MKYIIKLKPIHSLFVLMKCRVPFKL